jgi:5-formaminoimidazole-4-carboxamide-1-beta-D-ribofuranosyl 5'-monophosphate synthetase
VTTELTERKELLNTRIGVLGSHSALEIAAGAKEGGFETVVVCQNGREKTYARYYRDLFNKFIFVDKFSDITSPENVRQLTDLNTIFIPNRSFSVYAGYECGFVVNGITDWEVDDRVECFVDLPVSK